MNKITAYHNNPKDCVESVISRVGKNIVLGTPLGLGKGIEIINEFYNRAKSDSSINLHIITALTLEKPRAKNFLESRFIEPFSKRFFSDYPDLEYALDRVKNKIPNNITITEFFLSTGKLKNNSYAQRNYISTNYTHVARDMITRGVNVIVQLVSKKEINGNYKYSLSCNPDVTLDLLKHFEKERTRGKEFVVIGEVNSNLPFMYGDAVLSEDKFSEIYQKEGKHYDLFSTPRESISDTDYLIGLYCSSLVKDSGSLQVGIGSLGDATVYGLKLRHEENDKYQSVLSKLKAIEKFPCISNIGGMKKFKSGIFGATEMFFEGFLHLYKSGVIKRRVYDDYHIQCLLNEGKISDQFNPDILDYLVEKNAIEKVLTKADFEYLRKAGILKNDLKFSSGKIILSDGTEIIPNLKDENARQMINENCLEKELKNGTLLHGGFYLGSKDFYQELRNLKEEELALINMTSVSNINQLYGNELLDSTQRQQARFINSCMMLTLSGSVVSDGLEDLSVISGVGGQYNFVSMAHALKDGRSIINLRSTRKKGGKVKSNIVFNYPHCTIPRHLRDIVVTEYGIADLRAKSDEEIIIELLKVTDSRFQNKLLNQAKKARKISSDYKIPFEYRMNYPHIFKEALSHFKNGEDFTPFPFGSDFTEEEIVLIKALKKLKNESQKKSFPLKAVSTFLKPIEIDDFKKKLLKRMKLEQPKNLKEKFYQKLLCSFISKK